MSKTIGKWLQTFCKAIKPHFNTYRWLGMPSGVHRSTQLPSKLIYASEGYLFSPPMGKCQPKLLEKKIFYSVEARVWTLAEGIATCRASHYDQSAQLIWELSEQFRFGKPQEHPDFSFKLSRSLERMHHVPLEVLSLVIDGSRNLYHWLFDALPRLHLAQKAGFCPQALYVDNSRPFVRESLEMLKLTPDIILDASKWPSIQAKHLIVPSFVLYAGKSFKPFVPLWALQWLRESFAIKRVSPSPKRIFITRQDASYRFLKNEDQLFDRLKSYGFERYCLSSMNLCDQATLFASCDIVIAPHGAGLANLLFCEPGTRILELFHPGFVQDCYWQIANSLGLLYYCITGKREGIDLTRRYPFDDIEIDEQQLEGALKELGVDG